ncbi:MAG TPA: energy transducer TonB, partial [Rhizorhapis sp.]|nr:energy transducer TonB [Rhizorhapis sp.]
IAVVEFGIADNGTVASAHTVYSRGGPAVAAAFGKAVSDWYWKPEDVAAIPPFYRMLTRIELRCSNMLGSGGPGVMGPLRGRFREWATSQLPALDGSASNLGNLREMLHKYADESVARGDDKVRIAALGWLVDSEILSAQNRIAMTDEALGLATKTSVPQEVVNWLRIQRLQASIADKHRYNSKDLNALVTLSTEPAIAKDALAADTLMLDAARGPLSTKIKDASALLLNVAQDDRLPERHPLRQLAWLDLAGKAIESGDGAKAQDYFSRTGLSEEQCALLGAPPILKRSNVSSNDYPIEALMMGFEGWVQIEHDITTSGKTINARPLVAYPPLIFVDAATGMAKELQYEVSYRPGSSLACSAKRQTFNFNIPSNH